TSPVMRAALARASSLPPAVSPIVLVGEIGTEGELFARAIHVRSLRHGKPFVNVRCAGQSHETLLRELFGWTRGAFEGAPAEPPGRFELADGGTVVLHGFRGGTPELEARLSELLRTGQTKRLGAERTQRIDVRAIFFDCIEPGSTVENEGLARVLSETKIVL